ncbi:hypothetical protein DKM44_05210 [Deinococcus irradiatisoli]|uniref:Uncharacterized protein n=1 Tax=Deinococcus irradiatisoli TaxID=2202254 RepID=A0A2Z3JFC6_9DEIO|nr:hypothetical protein [Deinococcus irradiatisoli]AWN22706.1 hypothetical protein DKM44_05210 [Deinococcus irradiatisoli]
MIYGVVGTAALFGLVLFVVALVSLTHRDYAGAFRAGSQGLWLLLICEFIFKRLRAQGER